MSAKQKRKSKHTNRKKRMTKLPVKVVQSVPKKPQKETPKKKASEVRIFERHDFAPKTATPEIIVDETVTTTIEENATKQPDKNSFLAGEIQETVIEKIESTENAENTEAMAQQVTIESQEHHKKAKEPQRNWSALRIIASIILVIAVLLFGFALGRMIGQTFWNFDNAEAQVVQPDTNSLATTEVKVTRIADTRAQIAETIKIAKEKAAQTLVDQYKEKKLVALTFDDGPSPDTTKRLLDILREKSAKATFFVVGTMVQKTPSLVKQELAEGHEVGSHTVGHVNLSTLDAAKVKAEMAQMEKLYSDTVGNKLEILRPPYGATSATLRDNAGMPMVIWTVDTLDWKNRDANMVHKAAVSAAFDGAVILMHDIYPTTVDAVPGIIDDLRAEGYEFLTVSELAAMRQVKLEAGNIYGSFR